jgi:hypothetical protein
VRSIACSWSLTERCSPMLFEADCCPMDGINGLIQLTPFLAFVIPKMVSESVMLEVGLETSGNRGVSCWIGEER